MLFQPVPEHGFPVSVPPVRGARQDHRLLRWSAKALAPGLAAMAAARRSGAPTPQLRAELGAIGRCTEHSVGLAGGGDRGALWVLGLLVAAAALDPRVHAREVAAAAKRIAAHSDRNAPRRTSRGSSMSETYGAAGARVEPAPGSRTYGGRWTCAPGPARPEPARSGHGWTPCLP